MIRDWASAPDWASARQPLPLLARDFDFPRRLEELELRGVQRFARQAQGEQRSIGLDRFAGMGMNLRHDARDRRDHAPVADAGPVDHDARHFDLSPVRRELERFGDQGQVFCA